MGKTTETNPGQEIKISSLFITLGQFLKFADIISSGALAKEYLLEHEILVNGEKEARRGRKLYPGDKILLEEGCFVIVKKDEA